ncbi:M-phase inducer phosphatase [Arthroderma uncinatum]|uniref:M-phase inducer phosphatase n=1 Tax=Arthroderma uncinatum TaxID=74035 RepID=UPI00144AD035|nr:M-phase inducer phosphatase [Arthroderma uncinatum]KAF3484405.1 M-phase inducer phosphatase [Arthroderma uncinatum]
MEQSSPLAAMHPPSMHFGHCFRAEPASSFTQFPAMGAFGPDSFNFRDLSMKRARADYFNVKPVRGPSPTVSLAADLSQNFHIDQRYTNILLLHDTITTPPIPSSPAPTDIMEMSPLPHKAPFSLALDMDLESPTTELSMAKSQQLLFLPNSLQQSPIESSRSNSQSERRKPPMLRPSLMRTKAYSSSSRTPLAQPPQFKFLAGGSKLSTSTSISLAEMFEDSGAPDTPSARGSPAAGAAVGPSRSRSFRTLGQVPENGSPGYGSIRRGSNPFSRPRKLSRRSLSMFEHPEDVMKDEKEDTTMHTSTALQSITDMESSTPTLHLPHFIPDDQPDCLPRIENSVLVDIVNGKYNDRYENFTIIDCRFEYEYEGGHINGAVNYNDKEQLAESLFKEGEMKPNTALIFHCEYSAHRAPIMAKFIRHRDRAVNIDQYPKLTYPEMYILHGGYSGFFAEHSSLCYPQNYVEMASKEHEFACERGLGKVKQRSKLSRAQTFAFGQQSSPMEDSPTGRCRGASHRNMTLESPLGRAFEPGRPPERRMFSY